jgi:hypothetical protein
MNKGSLHRTNNPQDGGELNGSNTRVAIRDETRHQGADERSERHSTCNATLYLYQTCFADENSSIEISYLSVLATANIEVIIVGIGTKDTAHGRDIETKKGTTFATS